MWIVRVALDKPYTFVVMAISIALAGILAILDIPTDIFPNINIPVVAIVFTYNGMPPADISGRITFFFERSLTTQVNNIKVIQSNSVIGYGVVKAYFQPGVDISVAIAQCTAAAQTVLKLLPPGITPPYVLSYSADSVPVIQIALSGKISQVKLFDLANNFVRPQLAAVNGASAPVPFGGLNKSIMADLDLKAMQTFNVAADDVTAALMDQNLQLGLGTVKIGPFEDYVELNESPVEVEHINDMPVKKANGTVIYMRDVAHVHIGAPPQTNLVRDNDQKAALMPIYKIGHASTLAITSEVKDMIPRLKLLLPPGMILSIVGDQSGFVKEAIEGVLHEGAIAAGLTALLILLFLGSWRPTLIVAVAIPLSILAAIASLWALGETINVMTAGGLALAVGILVDDSVVTIENISVRLEEGLPIREAVYEGAGQIAVPALVSTLSIGIVFVPMFALSGVSHYLFAPLAESVMLALAASYILSRTLAATMARYLLKEHNPHEHEQGHEHEEHAPPVRRKRSLSSRLFAPLIGIQQGFERWFARTSDRYARMLGGALDAPLIVLTIAAVGIMGSLVLLEPWLGRDFFPQVYGQGILFHVSGQTGTRIEDMARLCSQIEDEMRRVIGSKEIETIVDNIDLPYGGIDMAYNNTGTTGPQDADINVTLTEEHGSTKAYIDKLREVLPRKFPGTTFSSLPADITSQVLDFGTPAAIDIQIVVQNREAAKGHDYAVKLLHRVKRVAGVVDARIQQQFNYPQLNVNVDRTFAKQVGLTQANVANSMLDVLAGSFQVRPNFWLDTVSGVAYPLETMAPQYRIDSMSDMTNMPVTTTAGMHQQILGGLGTIQRGAAAVEVSHYNVQPVIDIYANTNDRDLGSIDDDILTIIKDMKDDVPKGGLVSVRGQVDTMRTAYGELFPGIAAAVVLVYLLIVVNFQSWLDPFVIVCGLPSALAGIVWSLFLTFTPISVPALTGTIMCMGIATANSVLVIAFARDQLAEGKDSRTAAHIAGKERLRPVVMTASAMIVGMIPMSLGLGAGGAQNAPLGRAVIGGLLFATVSTLVLVPVIFSLVHRNDNRTSPDDGAEPAEA